MRMWDRLRALLGRKASEKSRWKTGASSDATDGTSGTEGDAPGSGDAGRGGE